MDSMIMEYSLNQAVAYERDGVRRTGRIVGHSGDNFIVMLDRPLPDNSQAELVPATLPVPLACHWCADTKVVGETPLTTSQIESGRYPTKPCPYCNREEYLKWVEAQTVRA